MSRRGMLQMFLLTGLVIGLADCAGGHATPETPSPASDPTRSVPTSTVPPTLTPTVIPTALPSPTMTEQPSPVPVSVAKGPEPTGLGPLGLPVRVKIPRITVNAEVEVVGLDADGAMSAPNAFDIVAWYGLGPSPGDPGASVIAGHVDSKKGPAIFWSLRDLQPGDSIEVDLVGGVTRSFVVEGASWFTPETAPLPWIFAPEGPPRLHLITCGGTFNPVQHAYDKRLVVAAHLAPTSDPRSTRKTS